MADQYKVVYDLSKGAIFSDLERPLPQYQGHALTQHKRLTHALPNIVISNDLE